MNVDESRVMISVVCRWWYCSTSSCSQ